jgi:hypothetical protein
VGDPESVASLRAHEAGAEILDGIEKGEDYEVIADTSSVGRLVT